MLSFQYTYKERHTSREGTIIIVDIGGFTKLVYNTDLITGTNIVSRLLSSIIEKNQLDLKVSEIEGDAMFFYKLGTPPSYGSILEQFSIMLNDFRKNMNTINQLIKEPIPLTLKMIVHYGSIMQYRIGTFNKLYGKVVMESHLLLKNAVNCQSYVLMTNDFLSNTIFDNHDYTINNQQCEVLRGIKKLCYQFFDFSSSLNIVS